MLIIQKPQQFHKEGLLDLKRWQERKLSEVALEMLLVPKPTPEVLGAPEPSQQALCRVGVGRRQGWGWAHQCTAGGAGSGQP